MDNNQQTPLATHNQAQSASKTSGLAITGLVLGIVGILGSWIPILNNVAFFIAILGLIFGIIGLVVTLKGTRTGKGLAIAAIVISVVAGGVVLATQYMFTKAVDEVSEEVDKELDKMSGGATEDILANSLDVEIGTFEATTDEYNFTETKLPVTVTNKLKEAKSFSVTVEAADTDGNRINTDIVYVDNLAPGQSYSSDIFTLVSSDEVEKYQNATFKVIEASEF